jgi:preprotein translocase subunit SecG
MPQFLVTIVTWFADNPWATALLMVLFIGVSVLMVLAILIQRPQGGGLAAAFGGSSAGSGQTALGTKTGDALTLFTISVFATFVVFGILLNYATTPPPPRPEVTEVVAPETAPATAPATTPATTPATAPTDAAPSTAAPAETKPAETAPAENKPADQPAQPAPTQPAPAQPAPTPAPTETPKPADPAQPKN